MATSPERNVEQTPAHRRLLACGIAGPLLFIVAFLVEGATRADYNPLRQPVSSLSIGAQGWTQIANFLITGSLLLVFAIGALSASRSSGGATLGAVLLGLAGIGLIGAGIFVADPLNGYPPGTPLVPVDRTFHGRLHDLFGIPVFLGLPAACLAFGWWFARHRQGGWAVYSVLSGVAMFVFFVLAGMGFSQVAGFADFAGVFQRLSLTAGLGWIALLALRLLKAP